MTTYEYTHDERGNITSSTEPDGPTTSWTYDEHNSEITKTTDGVTKTWFHTYDDHGNKLVTLNPDGTTLTFGYDERGMLVSEIASDGGTKIFLYDDDASIGIQSEAPFANRIVSTAISSCPTSSIRSHNSIGSV